MIENINDAVFQATDIKPEYDMADMHRRGPLCQLNSNLAYK
jgi:hypothetical protein